MEVLPSILVLAKYRINAAFCSRESIANGRTARILDRASSASAASSSRAKTAAAIVAVLHRHVTESARYRERSTQISSDGIGLFLNSVSQELFGFIATLVRNRAEHECFEIE
jgi:hypothetical protein